MVLAKTRPFYHDFRVIDGWGMGDNQGVDPAEEARDLCPLDIVSEREPSALFASPLSRSVSQSRFLLSANVSPNWWLFTSRGVSVGEPLHVGPAFPPAARHLREEKHGLPILAAYLLVHACQPFLACKNQRRLISGSGALTLSSNPSSRPP
jgi:hypothetical protein